MSSIYTCNKYQKDILNDYIYYGWGKLLKAYSTQINKIGKERCIEVPLCEQTKSKLELLGSARKLIIHDLFQCAQSKLKLTKKEISYRAFGSTNITSDYDLTIIGEKSPEIAEIIFTTFIKLFNVNTVWAIDTNIYIGGYFTNYKSNKTLDSKIIIYDKQARQQELFTLSPTTISAQVIMLKFALLKLFEAKLITSGFFFNGIEYNHIRDLHESLVGNLQQEMLSYSKPLSHSNEHNDIVGKYRLMFRYGRELYKNYIYDKYTVDETKMFELLCKTNYYAIDSYYTHGAINCVVFEIQGNKQFKKNKGYLKNLPAIDYLCTVIENIGDLTNNIQKENTHANKKGLLLKYSKYIYRIYYAMAKLQKLNKIHSSTNFTVLTSRIKKHVLAFRNDSINNKNISWSLLQYKDAVPIKQIISQIVNDILPVIFKISLNNMALTYSKKKSTRRKPRGSKCKTIRKKKLHRKYKK
tara:strand:- start:641 stop:2044 length:1404 start_codon:yes stop_codon:yes gene_type:complete